MEAPDRYEPLPEISELPRWLWRKLGRRLRFALLAVLLIGLAGAAAAMPAILESKEERAAEQRRERAEMAAQRIREQQAEQRPRFGRSAVTPPAGSTRQRLTMLGELEEAIVADARRRVRAGTLDGPIRRAACQPFPRTVDGEGAERDLSRRTGNYFCLAVTAEFGRSEGTAGGALGHPYRAKIDFERGRYAYCKVSGRPDPTPDPKVTTPRACGG